MRNQVEFYLVDVCHIYDDVAEAMVERYKELIVGDNIPEIGEKIIAAECERLGAKKLPNVYYCLVED